MNVRDGVMYVRDGVVGPGAGAPGGPWPAAPAPAAGWGPGAGFAPPGYAPAPGYAPPGYGPASGYAPPSAPAGPRGGPSRLARPPIPGAIIAVSVLSFACAAADFVGTTVGSVILMLSAGGPGDLGPMIDTYWWFAVILAWAAAGFLIAGGVRILRGDRDPLVTGIVAAAGSGAYWVIAALVSPAWGVDGSAMLVAPVAYLILPLVPAGLLFVPSARRWRPRRIARRAASTGDGPVRR